MYITSEPAPLPVVQTAITGHVSAAHAKGIAPLILRLARGSLVYIVANFGIRALNFLLLPLYTRFLSPADYGIVSVAETVAAVLIAVISLGLDAGVCRLYFQYVGDPTRLQRCISSLLSFAGLSTLLPVVVILLLGQHLPSWAVSRFSIPFYPYIAMAIATAALLQTVQYRLRLYQMQERASTYGLLAMGVFLTTVASVIALVVFVRWGAFGMLLGKLVAAILATMGAIYSLRTWLGARFEWKFVRETLPYSLPLVPHQLMALCLVAADRLILAHYRSLQEVGVYSLAYTLGMTMYLIGASIGQAWQPIYFDTVHRDSGLRILGKLSSGIAVVLTAIAIFGVQIAQYCVSLLDARYLPVGRLIPWIIGSYLLHAFFGLFQLALLEAKKTKFILVASATAFFFNLALNLWWIPLLGMYGAAYATLVAYGIEALLMYFYACRVFSVPYDWRRIFVALALLAAALGLSQLSLKGYVHILITLGILLSTVTMVWFFGGKSVGQMFKLAVNGETT
jgi:O-antigen/teichoic acid export membrane protein